MKSIVAATLIPLALIEVNFDNGEHCSNVDVSLLNEWQFLAVWFLCDNVLLSVVAPAIERILCYHLCLLSPIPLISSFYSEIKTSKASRDE